MAGPPDAIPEDDPAAAFEDRMGGDLWALSATDGKILAKLKRLAAPPVYDGLIAANGALYLSTADGKVQMQEGDFFGEMPLFTDDTPRSAWVKAKTECEVAELSYAKFKELAEKHTDLLYAVGRQMADRISRTTQKVSDLAFLDVTGRVARTLLELTKQPDAMTHPDGMQIKITRQEIGRIVGCSREMVGRVLKTLVDQGLVSVKGKTMVVYGTR